MRTIIATLIVALVAMIGGASAFANGWATSGTIGGEVGPGFTLIPVDNTGATAVSFDGFGGIASSGYATTGTAVSFIGAGAGMASGGASQATATGIFTGNLAQANSAAGAVALGPAATTTTTGTTNAVSTMAGSAASSASASSATAI